MSSNGRADERIPWTLSDAWAAFRRAWSPANQTQTALFASALLLLFVSATFGGASQTNTLSLMGVELASLPLLFVSLYRVLGGAAPSTARAPLALLAAIVAVPLLQLVPLPAALWTQLPGRGAIPPILDFTHLGRPSLPFSLAPQQTWRSVLALAPPAAMFLGALLLTDRQRRVMVVCWLALATVSVCIGGLQLQGGADSPLYFYAVTNPDSAVGLFSNRNHEAALLFGLIPLAAVFAAAFTGAFDDRRAVAPLLAILFLLLAIVGVAVTRSRAGVFLTGAALAGAAGVAVRAGILRRRWRAGAAIGAGVGVAVLGVLLLGLSPILARFSSPADMRFEGWPVVLQAAQGFLPLGSGVGSFETVYLSVEPLSQVSPLYFNHAHNDFLELWLETGVVGAALLTAFAVWLLARMAAIWTSPAGASSAEIPAAASVMILLWLAHSAVDYPLRTETLAVLFAFGCGAIAAFARGEAVKEAEAASARTARRRRVRS